MSTATLIVVIAVLAAGTYLLRLGGVLLANRMELSSRAQRLLPLGAVALLSALAATAALTDAGGFAGIARPVGVLAGVTAAWLRAPFIVAVVLAAAVTAGLRLVGIA
jgi:branched-subunit amino acid transport protein